MSKKLFVLLILLTSLSLIGIIFVQAYYINNTLENKEDQFWFKVKKILNHTTTTIGDREAKESINQLKTIAAQGIKPDSSNITRLIAYKHNDHDDGITVFDTGILEENYKIPTLIDIGLDSVNVRQFTGITSTQIFKNLGVDGNTSIQSEESYSNVYDLNEIEIELFKSQYREQAKSIPIHRRVSEEEINELLNKGLKEEGIEIPYEFAIYGNDLATKVQSDDFEFLGDQSKGFPIFLDNNGLSDYVLYVSFPTRNKYIFSSVIGITLLSFLFTLIIIIAYTSAIFQLNKQRKISQIKTDFINNMTHEFKTPIATINLALDAIKNPAIIVDETKVKRYLGMIKEENKRMHAQVENVLRISKLEKNELNISKDSISMHDLLLDAETHIALIVENRNGYINLHLDAKEATVLANESHFTNVLVNILDNAVKYSENEPKIDVNTENVGNNIIIKIKDQGNGMSKSVQKQVFEKFYREHTGNVHNVKGHGLGLAYVKRIVDDHHGHISVESEKGKGSTFIIKLPLIS
ncbi:GHKL domain-containing protein [Flavobacteriaceae bacterium AU392]|nr:sensor histidine kinase [Flavobacteriaceae bacterium]RKM86097.1 GHKL domain-containing protein [Flavobacteriaceae bacterium AU392]